MARLNKFTATDALMLVGGGVVAAGMALLFAPQSGRRTRREIIDMGKSIGRAGDRAVREFSQNMGGIANRLGDKAAGILREGKELTREGKRELLSAIEKGQETLGNRTHRLARIFG